MNLQKNIYKIFMERAKIHIKNYDLLNIKIKTSNNKEKYQLYDWFLVSPNFHSNNVFMYIWDETIAFKSAQEIVLKILKRWYVNNLRCERHTIIYNHLVVFMRLKTAPIGVVAM